jgi:hypothetical protein
MHILTWTPAREAKKWKFSLETSRDRGLPELGAALLEEPQQLLEEGDPGPPHIKGAEEGRRFAEKKVLPLLIV